MKITIADYEVNITAKDINNKKANKKDTLGFLNWLTLALLSAGDEQERRTCHAIANEMYEAAKTLYKVCKENGIYDN